MSHEGQSSANTNTRDDNVRIEDEKKDFSINVGWE